MRRARSSRPPGSPGGRCRSAISFAALEAPATPQWIAWDLTDLVADWFSGGYPNNGILLKLVDGQESYDVGGPAFPSSSFDDPSVRPRLEVTYVS